MRQEKLPRWRGFNLDMGLTEGDVYQDEDFAMIAALGFDFVRLPVCYDRWTKRDDPFAVDEAKLNFLDRGVRLAERYGLHVCLNLHRAPGFSVNGFEGQPFKLFQDEDASVCFTAQWETLAKRYRGQQNMSFNLLNEPRWVSQERHSRVMRRAVARIRAEDASRLILLDGVNTGNDFPTDLADLGKDNVGFSTRGYVPLGLTHYQAAWGHHQQYETELPEWPMGRNRIPSTGLYDGLWDKQRLAMKYKIWAVMAQAAGCGVVCGECGCFNQTPHVTALAWMDDLLSILTELNIGYALWHFRGPFGLMDSGRRDVAYQDYHGHALDARMLALLKRY